MKAGAFMSDERDIAPGDTPLPPEEHHDARVQPAPATTGADGRPPRRRGALWWGVVLVLLGAALLAGQFLPGIEPWRLWPLIIIALGVRQTFGPSSGRWSVRNLAEGITTIVLGLVFLGQMTGYLAWNVWLNILLLWPLLLVSFGLEIIGKALRNEWVRALGSLVVAAGLAYGALVMTPSGGSPFWVPVAGEAERFELFAEHEAGIDTGTARIEGAVGTMSVTAGNHLVAAEGATPFEPVFDVETDASEADVRVGLGSGGGWWPAGGRTSLDVALDEEVAWDLEVNAGVSSYELDLQDLVLRRLKLDAGVSEGTLTLGGLGEADEAVPVEVNAGVSSITIRVPRDYPVRVELDAGLTGIDVKGEWDTRREENTRFYESDEFSDDGAYWDIVIKAGVGSVTVEYY